MIDLAGFYAAIANEGQRVTPYAIDSIEQDGQRGLSAITPARRSCSPAATARRSISSAPSCEGVVARGTAALDAASAPASSAARPAPPTTRTTPGSSASPTTSPSRSGSATTTPAASARSAAARPAARSRVPIVEPIIQAAWNHHAPKTPLPPPSAEAARHLKALPIDVDSGQKAGRRQQRRVSRNISGSTAARSCATPSMRWSAAQPWRAAAPRPATGRGRASRPPIAQPAHMRAAAGSRAAANGCRELLRELFGL